jgi:hypothetical protein
MKDIIPPNSFKPKYKKEKKKGFFNFLKRKKDPTKKVDQASLKKPNKNSGAAINMDMARVTKKSAPAPVPAAKVKKTTSEIKVKKTINEIKVPSQRKRRSNQLSKGKFISVAKAKKTGVSWPSFALAFLIALLVVSLYFMRAYIPFTAYFSALLKLKTNITTTLNPPTQITFNPASQTQLSTLGHYVRQNKDRDEVLEVMSDGSDKVIFSFLANSLPADSVSLTNNYLAYIDSQGVELYSFKTSTTDLILASTQIAQPTKVYIDPTEKCVAFFITQNKKSQLFTYKISDNQIRTQNFAADDLIFSNNSLLYFNSGASLYSYNYVQDSAATKIETLTAPVLSFFKTNDSLLFVSGVRQQISLWQIDPTSSTASKLADFSLTFDYSADDFGVAQVDNNLYVSLAGETIQINLDTKEQKNYTFNLDLYKLLDYDSTSGYLFALTKPVGLDEYSLIIFKLTDSTAFYESSLESQINYLK